jgi:hypothetical protein
MRNALIIAAFVSLAPGAALAQDIADKANEVAEQARDVTNDAQAIDQGHQRSDRDDDDGFDWGLLGLLGLAGLLGLKRNDDHRARDIHVDARNDTRT